MRKLGYGHWQGDRRRFFQQPHTEHIGAVIANLERTISKFNRMGFTSNVGDPGVQMMRRFVAKIDEAKSPEPRCEDLKVCSIHHSSQ